MNRKQFLKTIGCGTIATFAGVFSGIAHTPTIDPELEDLYNFIESSELRDWTTYRTDHNGNPFKLHPFQKEILKTIHQHDNVCIVKARCIGMTTLLAGYTAWLSHRKNVIDIYHSSNRFADKHYYGLRSMFNKKTGYSRTPYFITYVDEANYMDLYMEGFVKMLRGAIKPDKLIVTGSLDWMGTLETFESACKLDPSWKVIRINANQAYPVISKERLAAWKSNLPPDIYSDYTLLA